MITLGGRSFAGPFLLPLWSAPRTAGVFAVLVPGWRLLTFRALHFGQAESFSMETIRTSPRFAEWVSIAGTDWNLYVATHEMSFSTHAQREAAAAAIAREYRPEFVHPAATQESPALSTMLLARALRSQQE